MRLSVLSLSHAYSSLMRRSRELCERSLKAEPDK